MTPENAPLPDWVLQERQADRKWIGDNLHIFWPAATAAYEVLGRGTLVVDITSRPIAGKGHPFGYLPQVDIEQSDDEDARRMVREYDPTREFIIALLKRNGLKSTYRIWVRWPGQGSGVG